MLRPADDFERACSARRKENAAWNVDKLAPYAEKGTPIVGLEPSCLLTLRDEYPEFVRTDAAKQVADEQFPARRIRCARSRKRGS